MHLRSFRKRRDYIQELKELALREESFVSRKVIIFSRKHGYEVDAISRKYKVPEPRGRELYDSIIFMQSRRVTRKFNARRLDADNISLDDSLFYRKEGFKLQDYQGRTG